MSAATYDLEVERVFRVPREQLFRMWVDEKHLKQWFRPKDFTTLRLSADFRIGGSWSTEMQSPAGDRYEQCGEYREIIPNEKIVMTQVWIEREGHTLETLLTVTFTDHPEGTLLRVHHAPFDAIERRDSHREGWSEGLYNLEAALSQDEGSSDK